MKRRHFALSAIGLVGGSSASVRAVFAQELDKDAFIARTATAQDGNQLVYDPKERLLYGPAPDGGNKLPRQTIGHPTRQSLYFAVALLNSKRDDVLPVALAVLDRVLGLQDVDSQSHTYGVWPKLHAEPLPKTGYFDRNWADFFASALLDVAFEHASRLPAELSGRVTSAIAHAARSIQKTNAPAYYSNIAVMGAYVALAGGQLSGDQALIMYGIKRLQTVAGWTTWNGNEAFSEYNSPTYTKVTLGSLNKIKNYIKNANVLQTTEKLRSVAWREIASHYHAPSGQWAGPWSRTYGDLASQKDMAVLVARARAGDCPPDLLPLLEPLTVPRTVKQTSIKGSGDAPFAPLADTLASLHPAERVTVSGAKPIVQTTYLHPKFALGSVNRGEFWYQRRLLIAHFGTPDAPSYLSVHLLRDGTDTAIAQFFSVQHEGTVLGAVCFAPDGADHDIVVKPKPGPFHAKNVRLRFELGGAAGKIVIQGPQPSSPRSILLCHNDDVQAVVDAPVAFWNDAPAMWEVGRTGKIAFADLVLYRGPEQPFDLEKLGKTLAAFVLQIQPVPSPGSGPLLPLNSNTAVSNLTTNLQSGNLFLSVPSRPAPVEMLHSKFEAKGAA